MPLDLEKLAFPNIIEEQRAQKPADGTVPFVAGLYPVPVSLKQSFQYYSADG